MILNNIAKKVYLKVIETKTNIQKISFFDTKGFELVTLFEKRQKKCLWKLVSSHGFQRWYEVHEIFLASLELCCSKAEQAEQAETPCGVGENILRLLRLAEQLQQQQKFGVYQSECPGNWLENCHTKGQHVSLHHYRVSSTIVIDCPLSTQLSQPHNNPYLHRFTLLFSACEMALI